MTDHTPTPWATETVKTEPDLGERMLVKQAAIKKGDPYVADTFIGMEGRAKRSKEECEANARLIVEAVNSHAALLALAEEVAKEYEDAADWKDARGRLLQMAENALRFKSRSE